MKTISIDDDVYSYIQSRAIPFEEPSPNETLRRLFELPRSQRGVVATAPILEDTRNGGAIVHPRTKLEKANLRLLAKEGLLKDGESLFLHDFRGQRIPGFEATVVASENALLRENTKRSMSDWAAIGLKAHGYRADSVSGPRHWHNSNGQSVRQVWEDRYVRAHADQPKSGD